MLIRKMRMQYQFRELIVKSIWNCFDSYRSNLNPQNLAQIITEYHAAGTRSQECSNDNMFNMDMDYDTHVLLLHDLSSQPIRIPTVLY